MSSQTDLMTTKQTEVQTLLDSNNLLLADLETQIGDNAGGSREADRRSGGSKEDSTGAGGCPAAGRGGPSYTEPSGGNVVSKRLFHPSLSGNVLSVQLFWRDPGI